MKKQSFLITGGSGLIGSALSTFLTEAGHEVHLLHRAKEGLDPSLRQWDIQEGSLNPNVFEGIDVVIHLSGETIAQWWSEEAKQRIIQSRVKSTQLLCRTLQQMINPPPHLLLASSIGYYGECDQDRVVETHSAGSTIPSRWCIAWEASSRILKRPEIRVAHLRFANVLSKRGGLLPKMLPFFRRGLGVKLPPSWMSWIHIQDLVRAIAHIAQQNELHGPINICSPYPATWQDFTKELARACKRPLFLSLPAWVIKHLGPLMMEQLLLTNTRAIPEKLLSSHFIFTYPRLDAALTLLLERNE